MSEDLLTTTQVAELLGISKNIVTHRVRRGQIPYVRKITAKNGTYLIAREVAESIDPVALLARPTIEDRFWAKVQITGCCWLWIGALDRQGYGKFGTGTRSARRTHQSHRFAYELLVGSIPTGRVVDHICRIRRCINPDHLELVTNRENLLRGYGWSGRQARKTHCAHGHEFTEENTRRTRNGHRECRECRPLHDEKRRTPDLFAGAVWALEVAAR